jgi:hypothetical protein
MEDIKTHCVLNNFFFLENRTVYAAMCKRIVQRGRPQMKIWRMRIACWVYKATNGYSELVILFFSAAKMVARARLIFTFIRTLTVLSSFNFVILFYRYFTSPCYKFSLYHTCSREVWSIVNMLLKYGEIPYCVFCRTCKGTLKHCIFSVSFFLEVWKNR